MAMISCPECSSEVSDTALRCPSCGVELRKLKRGFLGKLIKYSFIGFNILMIYSIVVGTGSVTEGIETMSEAEQTGTAIGAGLGMTLLLGVWVMGDIILGLLVLLTRPKS